jgi:S-adenosylmethionine hydrolase
LITLLTDFGIRDPSAAICHGVIVSIAPHAEIVDISHEVRKYAIRDGALLLWCALPYMPIGIHVAVIDPGVGTARRPIAVLAARGDVLIGPDNGLLMPGADRLGGIVAARLIENRELWLPIVTSSFHGRDIFSPVAAHLAAGTDLATVGPQIEQASLVPLSVLAARVGDGVLETQIVYVDTFGNVKLGALTSDLVGAVGRLADGMPLSLQLSGRRRLDVPWATTFGSVAPGAPLVYEDSYGRLCLADNQGDIATRLGLGDGEPVTIRRA